MLPWSTVDQTCGLSSANLRDWFYLKMPWPEALQRVSPLRHPIPVVHWNGLCLRGQPHGCDLAQHESCHHPWGIFFLGLYRSQQGNIGKQWENMGRVKPPSTVIWGSFADDPLTSTVVTKPLSWQPRRSWIFAYASIQRVSLVEKFVSDGLWIWFGRSLPTHIGIWL